MVSLCERRLTLSALKIYLALGAQAYGHSAIAYTVPPGLPKERLLTLQNGLMATMKDPEFLAEVKRPISL